MADFNVVLDPILDEMRADFQNGSGGSGGSAYVGGDRINIAGGTTSFVNSADIVNVTGTSVALQPDTAYKIYATSQAITLNANVLPAGKWAYDGHIEIFVAGTGYVVTGANVVLANALEPDAVNNCTVRFHDGLAIISVEDHVAGYIVVSATGSTAGTLPYALATATQEYVAFDAALNGKTLDMGGATTNGEKHVVGNGYTETIVSGAIFCTSKTTFANLGMNGVVVSSGTLTLGDVFIPSGATVAVSGGGLAIEKVSGNGGVIDLGGTSVSTPRYTAGYASGCSFTSGTSAIVLNNAEFTASNCTFTSNTAGTGAVVHLYGTIASQTVANLTSCTISGNTATNNGTLFNYCGKLYATACIITGNTNTGTGAGGLINFADATANLSDCILSGNQNNDVRMIGGTVSVSGGTLGTCVTSGGTMTLGGTMKLDKITGTSGSVTLSSGATIDLTGNTNTTPIAPGGGITFESGGATVLVGSGTASSSYMMDNVTLPTGAKLTNTAAVDLGGGSAFVDAEGLRIDGATITSGTLYIRSGAIIQNTDISNAQCNLFAGGSGSNVAFIGGANYAQSILSGTNGNHSVVANPMIKGGAILLRVLQYSEANNATVSSGGSLRVENGGLANEPVLSSGGVLQVYSGGTALLVTSNTGASVTVAEGGYITYKEA